MRTAIMSTFIVLLAFPRPSVSQPVQFLALLQTQDTRERQSQPPNGQGEEKQGTPSERKEISLSGTGLLGVGMEHRLYYKTQLLAMPEVLEELGLSVSQREKLKAAQVEQKKEFARLAQIIDKGNAEKDPEAKQAFRQQSRAYGLTLTREDERPLLKVLTIEQQKRLEQIQLQADSYYAFQLPDFLDKFDFLDIQMEQFKSLHTQARLSVAKAATSDNKMIINHDKLTDQDKSNMLKSDTVRESVQSTRQRVREAREANLKKFLNVMDSNQRKKYKILLGKPFAFPQTTDGSITKAATTDGSMTKGAATPK